MKHVFLLAVAFMLNVTANAQSVPNGGFENWTLQVVYDDPENWITLNMLGAFGAPATVLESNDAHSGNSAAMLETVEADIDGNDTMEIFPSVMTLGMLDMSSGEGISGAPVTGTPDTLVGWVKFLPQGGDEFGIMVTLSFWNEATQTREINGYGEYTSAESMGDYTRIAIPIMYMTEDMPDTMEIQITNSTGSATPGTLLYVDDLSLEATSTAAVADLELNTLFVGPNPADQLVTITSQQNDHLILVNTLGEKSSEIDVTAGTSFQLHTSDYPSGVYFLHSTSGTTHRLVIQH